MTRSDTIKEHLAQQVQLVEKQLDEIEAKNPDSYEAVHAARKNVLDLYEFSQLLVPATFLFVWHVLTLSVFYMGAYKLSAKLDYKLSEFPAFTEWQFDWRIIWFYMTGLLLYHFLSGLEQISVPWLIRALGANLLAISSMIYYIAGLSVLFFMFDKYKAGMFTRFLMSLLALIFTQAIVWFGIIDVWADFESQDQCLYNRTPMILIPIYLIETPRRNIMEVLMINTVPRVGRKVNSKLLQKVLPAITCSEKFCYSRYRRC